MNPSHPTTYPSNNIPIPITRHTHPAEVTNDGEYHFIIRLVKSGNNNRAIPFKRESHPKISTRIKEGVVALFRTMMKNPNKNANIPDIYINPELLEKSRINKEYSFLLRSIEIPTIINSKAKNRAKTKEILL